MQKTEFYFRLPNFVAAKIASLVAFTLCIHPAILHASAATATQNATVQKAPVQNLNSANPGVQNSNAKNTNLQRGATQIAPQQKAAVRNLNTTNSNLNTTNTIVQNSSKQNATTQNINTQISKTQNTNIQRPVAQNASIPSPYSKQLLPENITTAIRRTQEFIQKSIDNKQIPGCAVAIVYRNQIIFMNGYGVRTVGRPEKIDIDTVFQLGSVSKPIAATLASVLEQQGFLNLDNPVRHYLPNFTVKGVADQNNIRVKNILSHTTGVPRSGFNSMIEEYAPYSKIVRALQTTRSIATPGTKYDYHNAMYGMIADITERATMKPFPETLTSKLLRPLNMTHTSATLAGLMNTPNRATPHTKVRKGGLRAAGPYSSGYYAVAPAGGINSSVRDMANFLKAQMGGFPEVVSPKALARIQRPLVSTHNKLSSEGAGNIIKDSSYGLGWRILNFADEKMVYHGGWVKGFTNFIGFLPNEKLGIVVLQNGDAKFSAKTAVKFFEIAMGLPEAKASKLSERKNKKGKSKATLKAKANKISTKTSKKRNRSKNKK